jgi:hypothetical protein
MEIDFPDLDTSYPIHSRICESILDLFFRVSRQDSISDYFPIEQSFRSTLCLISHGDIKEDKYIDILGRITMFCRDVTKGKGERTASYALMCAWYDYDLRIFQYLFDVFIREYGGWRDAIGIASYAEAAHSNHPVIGFCVEKINAQLRRDFMRKEKDAGCESDVAKWIPRENKKDGWLFYLLVDHWFSGPDGGYSSHRYKCYRKICSMLTAQTPIGRVSRRVSCADSSRMVSELQRITLSGLDANISRMAEMNSVWLRDEKYIETATRGLQNILVVLDTGASMCENRRLESAIGIACRIVNRSKCRRMITVGHLPAWISFPEKMDFSCMVQTVFENIGVCGPKNIDKTFELLAHSCSESGMSDQEIGELMVVYLSDMHVPDINPTSNADLDLDRNIHSIVSRAGFSKLPHMVYWGIRPRESTPLPCEYNDPATTVVSGESAELLRVFNDESQGRTAYSNLHSFTRKYPFCSQHISTSFSEYP